MIVHCHLYRMLTLLIQQHCHFEINLIVQVQVYCHFYQMLTFLIQWHWHFEINCRVIENKLYGLKMVSSIVQRILEINKNILHFV